MIATENISRSAEETIELGRRLAQHLHPPVLVLLSGDLGSGKTTLSKGIINGLGAAREEDVTSPTFTLVHIFHNHARVYHVDLYRLEQSADVDSLGLEDVFSEPAVVLIEWPDRFTLRTDWPRVTVQLEHLEGDARRITVSGLPQKTPEKQ